MYSEESYLGQLSKEDLLAIRSKMKDTPTMKKWTRAGLTLCILLILNFNSVAQHTFRGKVVDDQYQALEGANIFLPSSGAGTTTDRRGRFELDIETDSVAVEISYLGYQTEYLIYKSNNTRRIVISLKEDLGLITDQVLIKDERFASTLPFENLSIQESHIDPTLSHQSFFNQMAGIQMQRGAYNTQKLMIRGIGSRSRFGTSAIRTYYDDIPITDGIGETVVEQIDLSSVGEMVVYKGPSSSKYGAALGGVIQYRSLDKYPAQDRLAYSYTLGPDAYQRHQASLQLANSTNHLKFGIQYSNTSADGWRENSAFTNEYGTVTGSYTYDKGRLSILGQYISLRSQIPSSLTLTDFKNSPSNAAKNWLAVQGYEDNQRFRYGISNYYKLTPKIDLVTALYTSRYDNFEVRPFNTIKEKVNNIGGRAYFSYKEDKVEHLLGVEVYDENYAWSLFAEEENANSFFDNRSDRRYFNYFLDGSAKLSRRWSIDYGFNSNITSYTVRDINGTNRVFDKKYPFVFSPRMTFSHSSPKQSIFLTFSHGLATPTVSQSLTSRGLFNPDLTQELAWNIELGYRKRYKKVQIHAGVYNIWLYDLLTPTFRDDVQSFENGGNARHLGFDATIDLTWPTKPEWEVTSSVNASVGRYKFTTHRDLNRSFEGNFLPGISPVQIATHHVIKYQGIVADYNAVLSSSRYVDDANTQKAAGFVVHNLSLTKKYTIASKLNTSLGLSIQNIFGARYANMVAINAFGGANARYYYPGQPRSLFATAKISF